MPLLSLAGCAGDAKVVPLATEPDLVGTRIAQAAEKASSALNAISGIEQQRGPALPPVEDYSAAPPGLTQLITVKWTGPIEQIGQTLSSRAGFVFNTKGAQPPVPLTVAVDVYQKPLIEVLRDLGSQAGTRADVSVDAQNGVIELSYAAVDKI
ncbi:DotD/TraH family lipoprotein [Propionivibrio sp.]|uniref:DotD/TraH family lipoprotein n=1 Tax=Propionivibrio sp. TaxID=2212460 RepID=UPI00263347AA|nr:DotD/TraH family lipoprotein [Propionivibrio sp.]